MSLRLLLLSFLLCAPLAAEVESRLIKVPDVVAHAQRMALEGRQEEALEELQALVTLAPGDADAWLALAWIHKDLGHAAESAKCLKKVKELMPSEAEALIQEGSAQHQVQKAAVRQEQVAKGVIGYTVVTGTVKDAERVAKPNKWTRKWDPAKPINIEEAAVEDGPNGSEPEAKPVRRVRPKPQPTLAPLQSLSVGPKIKDKP